MAEWNPELVFQLMDRHLRPLTLYARQWCENAEDVVQEALIRLVGLARAPDNPAAWLYYAVRMGAMNSVRAAGRRNRHESRAASEGEPWFEPTPSDQLEAAEATAALESLPLEQREVIIARLWGGLSFEEIAKLTDASVSTAHRRYDAGIAVLRERLGDPCSTKTIN